MISASLLRMRAHAPFFASLGLFARFVPREDVPTACTDGRDVFYNPAYLRALPARQVDGVLLHEVLHAAFLHATRRGLREGVRWNIAADVVVNGVVAQQHFVELPPGAVREPSLEDKTAEEIYELLHTMKLPACTECLRPLPGTESGGSEAVRRLAEAEAHWRDALRQAEAVSRAVMQGNLPAGIERALAQLGENQIDWRAALWRFLVRTPTDFEGFDRRFLSRRLYLENLEGDSVRVAIAIDTSGSIGGPQLETFMGEVRGIVGSYPHLEAQLYYADAALYGPFDVHEQLRKPEPKGGGGTSFVPFFDRVADDTLSDAPAVLVYLTDGYGTFPEKPPEQPVLWVVTPGGLRAEQFPFGEVVRLVVDDGR